MKKAAIAFLILAAFSYLYCANFKDMANLHKEIWRDVVGYEGFYKVSSTGRVKSIPRNGTKSEGRILKARSTKGYPSVNLSKNGDIKNATIHRLVGKAFLAKTYFDGAQINHKNGIKTDNNVDNLEWCTVSENARHAHATGLIKNYSTFWLGTKGGTTSKAIVQLSIDGKKIKRFKSATIAFEKTGICRQHISKCCSGTRKTAGGFLWQHDFRKI